VEILLDNHTTGSSVEDEGYVVEYKVLLLTHLPGGTHEHMFSEGADMNASVGVLHPCGGFFILGLNKKYAYRKTETKGSEKDTPRSL